MLTILALLLTAVAPARHDDVANSHAADSAVDSHDMDSQAADSRAADSRAADSQAAESHSEDSQVADSHAADSHAVVAPGVQISAVEPPPAPRVRTRSVGIDVVSVYNSITGGDVVLPVEFEAPMLYRLRFLGKAHFGFSTGAGAGLFGAGGQVGFRLYPFSPEPLKGFNIELLGGVTLPVQFSPVFGWPRLYATFGLGYAVRLTEQIQLTPGIEFTPWVGFPLGPPLAVRCGIAYAY